MSEAKQLFMEVGLSAQKQSVDAVEALNTFRGPQGPQGSPGGIDNLMVNGKKPTPVDGMNTIDLTAADVGALPAGGTATDASKLGGKAPEYYLQPRNLLDNSDFTNPVNQRGSTQIAASGYFIDRWYMNIPDAKATAQVTGNVIKINGNGTTNYNTHFVQSLNKENLSGKTITFAVKVKSNSLDSLSLRMCGGETSYHRGVVYFQNTVNDKRSGIIVTSGTLPSAFDYEYLNAIIMTYGNGSVEVEWAAVYEGSYTAETLPSYAPKGYAAELAECQRYFYNFPSGSGFYGYAASGGEAYLRFDLPQIMRIANPSVEFAGSFLTYSGSYYAANTINEVRGYGKQIRITVALNEAGTSRSVGGYINNNLLVSADL